MIKDHAQAVEILSNCIPYFNQVKSIDFSDPTVMRFTWRLVKYKLDLECGLVEEVYGHLLQTNNATTLMTALIKKQIELNSKS